MSLDSRGMPPVLNALSLCKFIISADLNRRFDNHQSLGYAIISEGYLIRKGIKWEVEILSWQRELINQDLRGVDTEASKVNNIRAFLEGFHHACRRLA
jgi:hypothetical protein